ncbi:hypothetical protein KBC04_03590 [Candidatus Babeliales bacterium]|nr:hypothetical protein [Candidatus Babeliales bacterium]MBP9843865.1 hypothetical protein [Candidatus Babeliales bacterium]
MKNLQLLSLTILMAFTGINLSASNGNNCKNENRIRNKQAWDLLSVQGKEIDQIRPSQIALMTNEQIDIITPEELNKFRLDATLNQIGLFNQQQIQSFSVEQILKLDSWKLSLILPKLSKNQFTGILPKLAPDQMKNVTINSLSDEQIYNLTPEQVSKLTDDQIKGLTDKQLAIYKNPNKGYNIYFISKLSNVQIPLLSESQIKNLPTHVLFGLINIDPKNTINPEKITLLTDKQIKALTGAQLSSFHNYSNISDLYLISRLTDTQLGYLTTEQINAVTSKAALSSISTRVTALEKTAVQQAYQIKLSTF